jgi:hypothetical protein
MPTARLRLQSFQRFWGMGELSIHRWKGFELYPVINKKTVSNVYEVGLSANRIPQLPQSATESIVCHALHTKYSIALYKYCNYKHYLDSTTHNLAN